MKNEEEPVTAPDPKSYGLERIDVLLDNADGIFTAGHTVTGKVILELASPIEALGSMVYGDTFTACFAFSQSCDDVSATKAYHITPIGIFLLIPHNHSQLDMPYPIFRCDVPLNYVGLRIRCKGEARVHFTDRSVGIRRKFTAEESYIHLEPYLVGDGESTSRVASNAYPFSLQLPEEVPCSFEGFYGRIRYSVKANLLLPGKLTLSSAVLPFSVASACDLNRDSLAPLPISETQSKTFIGQKEPLRMELSLPVRGFVPGQTVPMEIALKNESNVRVAKIRIVLKKVVTYHAKEKSRRHKEIVVEIELPVSRTDEIYREYFDVPSIPPSGMNFCSIIDVRYALKVEACVDLGEWYYRMLQKNLKIRTSIIIGTVPLKNYEDVVNEPRTDADELATFLPNGDQYEKSQIYRSSKPDRDDPTGDEGDSDGDVSPYSPMYRVYTFKKSKN